jgi:glutamate dehydrogenase
VSSSFCYLYLTFESKGSLNNFILSDIEKDLDNISKDWDEGLIEDLCAIDPKTDSLSLYNIFPKEYQYKFSTKEGAEDYLYLKRLMQENQLLFNLQKSKDNLYSIKIYSREKIILSNILPLIENLGFSALSQQMFSIHLAKKTFWLSEFHLFTHSKIQSSFDSIKHNVEEALHYLAIGELENDILCKLVVESGLKWRQVNILKAVTAYLGQTSFVYNKEYVKNVIVKHCDFAKLLIKFFEAKFFPDPDRMR